MHTYYLTGKVTVVTPLNVHPHNEDSPSGKAITRTARVTREGENNEGYPCIPGSTLRGALRAAVCHAMFELSGVHGLDPTVPALLAKGGVLASDKDETPKGGKKDEKAKMENLKAEIDEDGNVPFRDRNPILSLFGGMNPKMEGKVSVYHAESPRPTFLGPYGTYTNGADQGKTDAGRPVDPLALFGFARRDTIRVEFPHVAIWDDEEIAEENAKRRHLRGLKAAAFKESRLRKKDGEAYKGVSYFTSQNDDTVRFWTKDDIATYADSFEQNFQQIPSMEYIVPGMELNWSIDLRSATELEAGTLILALNTWAKDARVGGKINLSWGKIDVSLDVFRRPQSRLNLPSRQAEIEHLGTIDIRHGTPDEEGHYPWPTWTASPQVDALLEAAAEFAGTATHAQLTADLSTDPRARPRPVKAA